MVSEAQVSHVMALVKERHDAVRQDFNQLLTAYAQADQSLVVAANANLRSSLGDLKAAIAKEHWPNWLKDLSRHVDQYVTSHDSGVKIWRLHLDSMIANRISVESETWNFGDSVDILFDIDAIIDKAKHDNRVNELYGGVVECLRSIIDLDQIDSVKALTDLNRIISSLSKAQSGSFSSQIFNWQFARRLIPNIISSYMKKNSVTGPFIDAFEKTASELDVSLDDTKDQIGSAILAAAATVLRTEAGNQIKRDTLMFLEYKTKTVD